MRGSPEPERDSPQGRTPLDLLSAALKGYLEAGAPGEVYAYGNGANYQLGTGNTGLQARAGMSHLPCVTQTRACAARHSGVPAVRLERWREHGCLTFDAT